MNVFLKLFRLAGEDGMMHIILAAVALKVLKYLIPLMWAVGIVVFFCIVKELIRDKLMGKGSCEWKDIVCDVIGILVAL